MSCTYYCLKTRLYEALVLSTLLNNAELWPVSVTQMKKLDAAHLRWQRSILGISWKDKVTNEKVKRSNCTFKAGRHYQMQTSEMAWTSFTNGSPQTSETSSHVGTRGFHRFRRRPGRPRRNWKDVVKKDLRKMGISWDEVEEAAEDRRSWRNRVINASFNQSIKAHFVKRHKSRANRRRDEPGTRIIVSVPLSIVYQYKYSNNSTWAPGGFFFQGKANGESRPERPTRGGVLGEGM